MIAIKGGRRRGDMHTRWTVEEAGKCTRYGLIVVDVAAAAAAIDMVQRGTRLNLGKIEQVSREKIIP